MRLVLIITTLLVTACASSSKITYDVVHLKNLDMLEDSKFTQINSIIDKQQIYTLSWQQQNDFLSKFNNNADRRMQSHKKIARFLEEKLSQFNFYSDTLTASEALSDNFGNCLSLAIVTHSLAKLAKVDISYEMVESPPIYQKEGGIVLSSQHIRTILYEPKSTNYEPLWRSSIRIDYYPSSGSKTLRKVGEAEFISLYFQNKAAETLTRGQVDSAYWLIKSAIENYQVTSQNLNILALVHERKGYYELAEEIYQFALYNLPLTLELLSNYERLLLFFERYKDAEKIAKLLQEFEDHDPFQWIALGDIEYSKNKFSRAVFYYKKALKNAGYLHEPYYALARAYLAQGKMNHAKKAMKKALEKANKKETKSIYQQKYEYITKLAAK